MKHHGITFALALSALGACQDSINKGWFVDRTRVLAARVEAGADTTRASIAPGEHARIQWLVGSPSGAPPLAWSWVACAPPSGSNPEPLCETPVLGAASGSSTGEIVTMELDAPPLSSLGGANELLVLAAFCANGSPVLDPALFSGTCSGGGDAFLASVRVRLAVLGPNQNPAPPSGIRLGDHALAASEIPAGGPCTPELERIRGDGSKVDLVYAFRSEDREAGETLLLTHVVTDGELDHAFASLDVGDPLPREDRVPWTTPTTSTERVVRFFVVLRDLRGGASFTRVSVCLTP